MAQMQLLRSKTAAHLREPTVTQTDIARAKARFLSNIDQSPSLTDGDKALIRVNLIGYTNYLSAQAR